MTDQDKNTRVDKFEKRRKNTKTITILSILAAVLLIVLIGIWIFGGGDKDKQDDAKKDENNVEIQESTDERDTESADTNESDAGDKQTDESKDESDQDQEDSQKDKEDEDASDEEEVKTEPVESTDDPNVIEAYTGNWKPVGTEQTGPHTTTYDDGSADRIEIRQAVTYATGLAEDDMIEHWIGNGGDQKVVATVSNNEITEIYRVYLSWNDDGGWQPTKVEQLKEVDY